jgi:hypothetical protein
MGGNIKFCLKEMGHKGAEVTSVLHGKVKLLVFEDDNNTLVSIEKGHF